MTKEAVRTLAVRLIAQDLQSSAPTLKRASARLRSRTKPAIERAYNRAHASSAHEVRVALAAIANLLRHRIPEWLCTIDRIPRDRV